MISKNEKNEQLQNIQLKEEICNLNKELFEFKVIITDLSQEILDLKSKLFLSQNNVVTSAKSNISIDNIIKDIEKLKISNKNLESQIESQDALKAQLDEVLMTKAKLELASVSLTKTVEVSLNNLITSKSTEYEYKMKIASLENEIKMLRMIKTP